MAEETDFGSRTEDPTPRRREDAAEKGQFAFSADLTTGVVLIVGVGALAFLAHRLGDELLQQTRGDLLSFARKEMTPTIVQRLLGSLFGRLLTSAGVLIGLLFAASLAAGVAQVGLRLNSDRLSLDWARIAPTQFSRLFSWSKVGTGLIMTLKIVAVALVAWWILRQRGAEIAQLGDASLASAHAHSWSIILRLALGLAGTLLVIGVLDYAWQRWRFENSLMMTKQELKEEIKREDGDPQIKARIRKAQREIARRKMFQQVKRATVIVTNPTHLAVALFYESGTMAAPKVIAKGAGHVAKRIVELAREHGVPVLERKPLAQALYKTVKLDQEVPLGLYLVVAELLAYVYRLKHGTRQGDQAA